MTPRPEVRHYSRNQSSRNGAKPQIIVLHSTEGHNRPGLSDLVGLGNYFDSAGAQASSHVANDGEGNDARFVPDSRKAWTQAGFNPVSLSVEQTGFAAQTSWPEAQLKNTAEWIAYWSRRHGIPIQRGEVSGGSVTRPGVVFHADLGAVGGGHHDPGVNYPLAKVLTLALQISPAERKRRVWAERLTTERARLKSLLALRARLRQQKFEHSARYGQSTADLDVVRTTINRLKRLVGRG